ncbi:MAG TPA: demethoxyubiquinone hydroxylase family protein [Allosphingosinicella sp.]|jgi:ubiquinone biosynthesis monooxygenase Coq7
MSARPSDWRPGDPPPDTASMLRVDQAGEYGATRIYGGQAAVLGNNHPAARLVAQMATQEARHLAHFDRMMAERGVRPTLLQPIWHAAGHALGAVTALISPQAAMACTAAVEDEIDAHYEDQRRSLGDSDPPLAAAIEEFQAEEVEHRDLALANGARDAAGFPFLYSAVRAGCRAAIFLSKRI